MLCYNATSKRGSASLFGVFGGGEILPPVVSLDLGRSPWWGKRAKSNESQRFLNQSATFFAKNIYFADFVSLTSQSVTTKYVTVKVHVGLLLSYKSFICLLKICTY